LPSGALALADDNASSNNTAGAGDDSETTTSSDEIISTSSDETIIDDNNASSTLSTSTDIVNSDTSTSSDQIIDTGSASTTDATSSIATSTPAVATSTPIVIATSTEATTATSTATTTLLTSNGIPVIKIASVYTIGLDDYIDLYNPNNFPVDLAYYNYRLERSKTAIDPDILMRIGDASDGVYPGGTIIAGNGYYRIVRDEAADGIKAGAKAIGSSSNFTFDENSSYTLYLGTGPISSPTDPDIVDIYNVAPMALTSTPATSTDLYGVYLPGLAHLWHFDECRGTSTADYIGTSTLPIGGFTWGVGAYGCSLNRSTDSSVMTTNFPKAIDASNFSLNFNYKNTKYNPARIFMSLLKNDNSGQFVSLQLDFTFTEYQNLPTGVVHNTSVKWPADDAWHQVFLVVNGPADYFELYLDGQKVYHKDFDIRMLPFLSNYFRISPDNGLVSLDEVGLWSRPLAETEIKQIYDAHLPLYPTLARPDQKVPTRLDYYAFNERVGTVTKDAVGVEDLTVNANSWIKNGHSAGALFITHSREILKTISTPRLLDDVSLDFWYREHLTTSSMSRIKIALNGTVDNLFGLEVDQYYQQVVFNSQYETMGQGYDLIMPRDLNWHHAALVYDSYKYLLSFYVDGVLKWSASKIWIRNEAWQKIEIGSGNGQTELDNLEIWDGALNADEVMALSKM